MKYLVNFEIVKQGFSEIVEASDKEQALEKAKQYLVILTTTNVLFFITFFYLFCSDLMT